MSYIPQAPGTYQGNQVIINSDRLVFNAKIDSILLFSDKAIGFSTNGSFHFDTSPDENESKFVVNSPNIYLGLEFDNTYPTEPAVLGDQLEDLLNEILDLVGGILNDIEYKVGYIVTVPSSPTAPNPANTPILQRRRSQIQQLKSEIENIKSLNTKLV
jgi:hypothetical protein|tara:strand:+ start:2083 stop:2556 length:474 start_codon:yes stop_codon:yes gene_type:complete